MKQFEINTNNREFFDLLSSKLYNHKELAVLRELSTNASDAHKLINKADVPFEVHLPLDEEPYFSIRDFGPGLSEEEIYNVYTVYGKSTKQSNENLNGAMGVGSKSPFALVDEFEVISYHGGKKTVYRCFKHDGIPSIEKILEENSDEETGLKITLEIKDNKTREKFQKAAVAIYQFFKTKPVINILSVQKAVYNETLENIPENGFIVISNYNRPYPNDIIVKMGDIPYAVPFNVEHELLKTINTYTDDIIFHVEEKSMVVSASREYVAEVPENKELLESIMQNYYDKFIKSNLTKFLIGYSMLRKSSKPSTKQDALRLVEEVILFKNKILEIFESFPKSAQFLETAFIEFLNEKIGILNFYGYANKVAAPFQLSAYEHMGPHIEVHESVIFGKIGVKIFTAPQYSSNKITWSSLGAQVRSIPIYLNKNNINSLDEVLVYRLKVASDLNKFKKFVITRYPHIKKLIILEPKAPSELDNLLEQLFEFQLVKIENLESEFLKFKKEFYSSKKKGADGAKSQEASAPENIIVEWVPEKEVKDIMKFQISLPYYLKAFRNGLRNKITAEQLENMVRSIIDALNKAAMEPIDSKIQVEFVAAKTKDKDEVLSLILNTEEQLRDVIKSLIVKYKIFYVPQIENNYRLMANYLIEIQESEFKSFYNKVVKLAGRSDLVINEKVIEIASKIGELNNLISVIGNRVFENLKVHFQYNKIEENTPSQVPEILDSYTEILMKYHNNPARASYFRYTDIMVILESVIDEHKIPEA